MTDNDHIQGLSLAMLLLNREIHHASMAGLKVTVSVEIGRTLNARDKPSTEHSPAVAVTAVRPITVNGERP